MTDATFYTVGSRQYFPGTVALLNSMRLTGNLDELVVLDVGLAPHQQDLLRAHSTLVDVPHEVAINPLLLKPFPAVLGARGVVVVIDSDIIVTGSLSHILDEAREGKICVYADHQPDRWFPEWEELLQLTAPLRRGLYVNSGVVAFSTVHWPSLLERWHAVTKSIPSSSTRAGGAARDTPLWDGDQDALNAILLSEIPSGVLSVRPTREAPSIHTDRRRVQVVDVDRLTCTLNGRPSYLVHTTGTPKPWEATGWERRIREDAYARLYPRVVFGEDVAVRLEPADVPLWLRPGRVAGLMTRGFDLVHPLARFIPPSLRRAARAALHRVTSHRSSVGPADPGAR